MRMLMALTLSVLAAWSAGAEDKKRKVVEMAGMKSAVPADWKEADKPGMMRTYQFSAPKADGDSDDADISTFFFAKGQGGSIKDNLPRQRVKFQPAKGQDKLEETLDEKFKVGTAAATRLEIKGVYQKKAFPMAPTATPVDGWRMIYVAFETADGLTTLWILGPEKTVAKHQKGFDEWLTNFK